MLPLFSATSARSWGIGEMADIVPLSAWLAAGAFDRLMILPIPEGVLINVAVVEKGFVLFDPHKGVRYLPFAGAQSLHLRAVERDPGFKRVENVVIPAGLGIRKDLCH